MYERLGKIGARAAMVGLVDLQALRVVRPRCLIVPLVPVVAAEALEVPRHPEVPFAEDPGIDGEASIDALQRPEPPRAKAKTVVALGVSVHHGA